LNLTDWATLNDLPLLTTTTDVIDRVTSLKLLAVYIDLTMSWTIHVDNIVKTSSSATAERSCCRVSQF